MKCTAFSCSTKGFNINHSEETHVTVKTVLGHEKGG